jgi:hypothetical protein
MKYLQEPTYHVSVVERRFTLGEGWRESRWEQTTFAGHAEEIRSYFEEQRPTAKVTVRPATQAEHSSFELELWGEEMLREAGCGSMITR